MEDFDWPWGQHAPKFLPNGDILMFDNGDLRNFGGNEPEVAFSRAVIYRVNETDMSIQQQWSYGESRGSASFSRVVSEADYLEATNSVSITFGSVENVTDYAHIVEVDVDTDNVLFEAQINPPNAFFSIVTAHRSERVKLYP